MKANDKKDEVKVYRIGRITILQLMAILAIVGLVATWVLHSFFSS